MKVSLHGPLAKGNLSGGHSEPHPNIMGPPGIIGLLISGKNVEYWYSSANLDAK